MGAEPLAEAAGVLGGKHGDFVSTDGFEFNDSYGILDGAASKTLPGVTQAVTSELSLGQLTQLVEGLHRTLLNGRN